MCASGVISAYSASVHAHIFVTVVVVHVVSFKIQVFEITFSITQVTHHRKLSFCTDDQSRGWEVFQTNVLPEK